MKKHSISVSMIVKNEESCIAKALESVKDADEIIVCDTGSTDRTIEIARQYTDKVFTDYKWNDNFAEARNHAQSKCTGDYILIIDADEYLEPGKMDELRTFDGSALNFRTISDKSLQEHPSIRLHLNTPEIYWIGAAHNYLNVAPSHQSEIIMYFGYSPAHALDPDRTMRILEKDYKVNPENKRTMYYLALEYIARNRRDDAREILEKYLINAKPTPETADVHLLLARLKYTETSRDESMKHAINALAINPDFKEAYYLIGDLSRDRERMLWHKIAQKASNNGVLFARARKRIVVTQLSIQDFAGVGYEIVRSIRKIDQQDVDIEQIVYAKTAFGIPCGPAISELGTETVQERINRSDIIFFSGDWVHNGDWQGFKLPEKAKRIYWTVGSFFRRNFDERVCFDTKPLESYVADYKAVGTPELVYADDWNYLPAAFSHFDYVWTPGEKFTVAHIPSDKGKKGTDLVEAAMKIVKKKRRDIEYLQIQGSYIKTMEQKLNAHLYLDQFLLPVYGKATIEALAFGVPVLTWLDGGKYYPDGLPVQTPSELTPEAIAEKVIELCDWKRLEELSKESYKYAQEVHGTMGKKWIEIFKQLNN